MARGRVLAVWPSPPTYLKNNTGQEKKKVKIIREGTETSSHAYELHARKRLVDTRSYGQSVRPRIDTPFDADQSIVISPNDFIFSSRQLGHGQGWLPILGHAPSFHRAEGLDRLPHHAQRQPEREQHRLGPLP